MTDRAQATPIRQPSRTRLSDGRELLYFDDEPGIVHDGVDRRELPRPVNLSQARWDVLTREWTVIAGHRQQRTFRPATSDCPLCPSRAGNLTEIPESSYDVVVFENRFPSLAEPLGRCEVVCFTSAHDSSFAALSPQSSAITSRMGWGSDADQILPFQISQR